MMRITVKILALSSTISTLIISCNHEVPTNFNNSPVQTQEPIPTSFDVFCFKDTSFSSWGDKCSPEQMFKIKGGVENKAYLKTETSVQSGTNMLAYVNLGSSYK